MMTSRHRSHKVIAGTALGGSDAAKLQEKHEHMARGIEYRDRGKYVKAIDEFAKACQLASMLNLDCEECFDNLEQMLFVLHYFFNPDVDPDHFRFWEGEPLPEANLKVLAAKTAFPPSHLVVGGNYVFASYPLTEEGEAAAIEHAWRLAHNGWPDRHKHPGTILGDVPDSTWWFTSTNHDRMRFTRSDLLRDRRTHGEDRTTLQNFFRMGDG